MGKPNPLPLHLAENPQSEALLGLMADRGITHGMRAEIAVGPVGRATAGNRILVAFCPVYTIAVIRTFREGDGGELPAHVEIQGLTTEDITDRTLTCKIDATGKAVLLSPVVPVTESEEPETGSVLSLPVAAEVAPA